MKINILTLEKDRLVEMVGYQEELKRLYKLDDLYLYQAVRTELKKCLKVLDNLEDQSYIDIFKKQFHDITINGVPCKVYGLWWIDKHYKGKYAVFYK